jgi:hypothetical protein
MLKILIILINLAILNSQHHILNIEQGDSKVSRFLDQIGIKKFYNRSVSSYHPRRDINIKEPQIDIFEPSLNNFNPDFFPYILVQNLRDYHQPDQLSYIVDDCETCLFFNYIDHTTPSDPSVNCDLSFPGREYEIKSIHEDDKYRADKVMNFGDFNIILQKGKLFFAQYEDATFSTYKDIGRSIHELKDKMFIDAFAFEYGGILRSVKIVYILCHTENEIFVFSIQGDNHKFTLEETINKPNMGLDYKSISGFYYDSGERAPLTILYTKENFDLAIIVKGKVEKRQIIDDNKNPLLLHDAKFSTYYDIIDRNTKLYFIVKTQGLYVYDIKKSKIIQFINHPYLTQIDKLTKGQVGEFVAVYAEQHDDIEEALIEFYFDFKPNSLVINKIYTTNNLKFQSNLVASNDFYYLYSKDSLYLLPARQPNVINAVGTKVSLAVQDDSRLYVLDTKEGRAIVINDKSGSRVLYEKTRGKKVFQCEFGQPGDFKVTMQSYTGFDFLGMDSHAVEANVHVYPPKKLLFLE